MPIIEFEDAPTGVSSSLALVPPCTREAIAIKRVNKEWNRWLSGKAVSWPSAANKTTTAAQLANALMLDQKYHVPRTRCLKLVEAFTAVSGALLRMSGDLSGASPRLNSMASEIIAIASTIHIVTSGGKKFHGTRKDVNDAFGGAAVWTRRWSGFGPDYLFSDLRGNATFVEIKGEVFTSATKPRIRMLKGFCKHKAQSLNADLAIPAPFVPVVSKRYVLSRVRKAKSGAICVQWFNEEQVNRGPDLFYALGLAVALSHYRRTLEALLGDQPKRNLIDSTGQPLHGYTNFRSSPSNRDEQDSSVVSVYIPIEVSAAFDDIESFFADFRNAPRPPAIVDGSRSWQEESRLLSERLEAAIANSTSEDNSARWKGERDNQQLPMGIVFRID